MASMESREPPQSPQLPQPRTPATPATPATSTSTPPTPTTPPVLFDPVGEALGEFAAQVQGLQGDALHAYDDLEFYSRYVIGYDDDKFVSNSKMIKRIYEELQYSPERDILILGPRQSAKSTAVTVAYTSWMIGRNPLIRYLLAFAAKELQGYPFSRQLGTIIENNSRYIDIFGALKPVRPQKWTDDEKIVRRSEPPGGLKDATITVVGFGTNIPSKRSDEIVLDDVVTAENAYSLHIQDRLEQFMFQTLMPINVPNGRTLVVGSRWSIIDLYGRVANKWGLTLPESPTLGPDQLAYMRRLAEDHAEMPIDG